VYGHALVPPRGTRPARPAKAPPFKPNVACYKNPKPDLNGPAAKPGAGDQILRGGGRKP
jgi:hypothetical protein